MLKINDVLYFHFRFTVAVFVFGFDFRSCIDRVLLYNYVQATLSYMPRSYPPFSLFRHKLEVPISVQWFICKLSATRIYMPPPQLLVYKRAKIRRFLLR